MNSSSPKRMIRLIVSMQRNGFRNTWNLKLSLWFTIKDR